MTPLPPHVLSRYTPQSRAELAACLVGLGDDSIVKVRPAAAELLGSREVHTVRDVLNLPAWPHGRLRIVIERWPRIGVVIESV